MERDRRTERPFRSQVSTTSDNPAAGRLLAGMLGPQAPRTPSLESGCCRPVCSRPVGPGRAHTCVRVRTGSDPEAMPRKPCSTVAAAHQNSTEQFRSRSKDCVIITSYR